MSVPALKSLTVDQFLEWDHGDDRSYDLVHGEVVAMAPTQPAHQIIAANIARRLSEALDARPPCNVRVEAPIVVDERGDTCHHADLAVTCRPHEPHQKATPEPILIVEVLSPSTENHDRTVKVPDYRALPSVQEIVLVDQQKPYCEIHRRLDDGRWLTDLVRHPEARLRLDSLGFDQPLSVIYAHVAFDSE